MFGRPKCMPEEMRMRYGAPSFSLRLGLLTSPWTREECRKEKDKFRGKVVLLYPGINMLNSPREWAKILSDAYYVVISAVSAEDEPIAALKKAFEREIYSHIVKHLTGVSVVESAEDALSLIKAITESSERECVTLNNTEEEIK